MRLVAGDAGHHDVALLGHLLGPGHDEVAVEDAGLDHRLAPDPEHEEVALAAEVGGDGKDLLDVLLGQHVGAGGDVADEGDVAERAAIAGRAGVGVVADLEGAGLDRVAPEVAELVAAG